MLVSVLVAVAVYLQLRYLGLLVYDTFHRCRGRCLPNCPLVHQREEEWLDGDRPHRWDWLVKALRFPRRRKVVGRST